MVNDQDPNLDNSGQFWKVSGINPFLRDRDLE